MYVMTFKTYIEKYNIKKPQKRFNLNLKTQMIEIIDIKQRQQQHLKQIKSNNVDLQHFKLDNVDLQHFKLNI